MPSRRSRSAEDLVAVLTRRHDRDDPLTHLEHLPARPGRTAEWPSWAAPEVAEALRAKGIRRPWQHQVQAAEAAYAGRHVVVATGTASGKSLAFQLPALTRVLASRRPNGRRGATVLYLSPTKALAQDQLSA